ncbi:unnamed protein product [Alopecurus aequalis]
MELVYLERRNGLQDESAAPEFSGRSEDSHQHLTVAAPEVHSNSVLVNYSQPILSDEKKSRNCQTCHRSPCSCGGGDVPYSELCPTLPAKMMVLEFLIRSLRHPTRTHNVSDLDDLISDGTSTGDVTLGTSEMMMLDSLHALVNAKTRPKSPSFFLAGAKMRKTKPRSHSLSQSEILKLISPETWEMSSPMASPLKTSTAHISMHEKAAPSCSDTAHTSSDQPVLSSHPNPLSSALSAGLLQCIWKDGLPHFELSLDNPMAVYTATPIRPHGSDKAVDYVYLFHAGGQGKKDWMGNSSNVSKLVSKMKVSSSLLVNSDKSTSVETEFTLYGSPDDYLRQMHTTTYGVTKGKGLVKRVAEIMRSPNNASSSPKHAWGRFGKPPLQQFDGLRGETVEGELGSAGALAGLVSLAADDLPANQEIAVIVVREQQRGRREEATVTGGWGLKFLEKACTDGTGTDVQDQSVRRIISAIVPRGYHGGVACESSGPSGLVERWRSGGRCDCGGWDLGCPIRVLNNNGGGGSSSPQDGKSVELSLTGVRSNEAALRLVNVTEGLYIIYFDSSIVSPLQCFSAGVALVHSQAPQLCPKL